MSDSRIPVDREAVRALVRQVLRDVVPASAPEATRRPAGETAPATADPPGGRVDDVAIGSNAELAAFVRRLAGLFEDAKQRDAIKSGRHRFRLKQRLAAAAAAGGGIRRIDGGLVTERLLTQAAAAGQRLVLGKKAVLTPLARDKARQLGVQIERD